MIKSLIRRKGADLGETREGRGWGPPARRRGQVPPPSSRKLRVLESPGVYPRFSPAWGPVSRVQKKLDACRRKPLVFSSVQTLWMSTQWGNRDRKDPAPVEDWFGLWASLILRSPSLPLRPASSAESCPVGRLYPLSHFSAFRINWSWQPMAPTGIWQRLSNRRGECHVYAAGCPRRACAFCLAVLDSATPERLLTCLRTPSRTSQKSWLDGQARAWMAGSVIWTFPVGCGDPWKVSEQVSGRFGADLVGKWTQALEILQVPLCIPLLWRKPTWVRGHGKVFSLKFWLGCCQPNF